MYIPLSGNPIAACNVIHAAVAALQTSHPSSLISISGDFNHVNLDKTLITFTQYVDCPTREGKRLDLLYANMMDLYSSSPLPFLGSSHPNLVT